MTPPSDGFRIEKDTLGEVRVPRDALWGPRTQRAVEAFQISGLRPHPAFVRGVVLIKKAAALANAEAGRLSAARSDAIVRACDEILDRDLLDQFVIDPFQAGAGVSHHMNESEVVAQRANEIAGHPRGTYALVTPEDHVNMGQSTNDVIPTAIRRASLVLGIGGTAAGTGLNADPQLRVRIVRYLHEWTGEELTPAKDLFAAMQTLAPAVELSSALRGAAIELSKIANDLRLLVSGPRTGFGEVSLPVIQPGSSIMPAKVNPVIPEMLNMVCFQVIGNDEAVAWSAEAGQLEMNVMMPKVADALCFSLQILTNAVRTFRERCIVGISADADRAKWWIDQSPPLGCRARERALHSERACGALRAPGHPP